METKRLIETENSIQEFTVQFYGGTVMIEQNQLPLGQISCELLDYPVEELLALHDEAVRLFSIVRDSLFARDKEKSPALAAAVQRQLNRALKHVYPLPLFSLLNIDRDTYGTMLEELCRSAPEEFQKAVTPGTPENEALSSFFGKLFRLPDELLCFQSYVSRCWTSISNRCGAGTRSIMQWVFTGSFPMPPHRRPCVPHCRPIPLLSSCRAARP